MNRRLATARRAALGTGLRCGGHPLVGDEQKRTFAVLLIDESGTPAARSLVQRFPLERAAAAHAAIEARATVGRRC